MCSNTATTPVSHTRQAQCQMLGEGNTSAVSVPTQMCSEGRHVVPRTIAQHLFCMQ